MFERDVYERFVGVLGVYLSILVFIIIVLILAIMFRRVTTHVAKRLDLPPGGQTPDE